MMHIKIVSIAIAVSCLLVANVQGQEIFRGQCSDFPVKIVQEFEGAKFLGYWYEIKRFETTGGHCGIANYSSLPNNEVKVINVEKMLDTGESKLTEAVATFVDPSKREGNFYVKYPGGEGNYLVIGTDYETYSIVWSCYYGSIDYNSQFLWVYSRKPTLSSEKLEEVDKILNAAKLPPARLRETIQDASVCHW